MYVSYTHTLLSGGGSATNYPLVGKINYPLVGKINYPLVGKINYLAGGRRRCKNAPAL
jgi:hypothetical protein